MNIIGVPSAQSENELENKFVLCEQESSQYSIVFTGSSFTGNQSCIIPVKNRREVELLLLMLRTEATVIADELLRNEHGDVYEWLYGRTYAEIFNEIKFTYREEDEVIDIIEKIPLPQTLDNQPIQIYNYDSTAERINQEFVHKHNRENVLISEPSRCGHMLYFKGFTESREIMVDHESDHLEGILIFEAARQAGIASAHLEGMPFSGALVILKAITRYSKFLESGEPYMIRTMPAYKSRGGVGYCVYNIIQKGKSCASGYFSVIAYNSRDTYNKFRNSKTLERASGEKVTQEKVVGM